MAPTSALWSHRKSNTAYVGSWRALLDLIRSSTRYLFPKPQQEHSWVQYHRCFNENLFQSIIKKWLYRHFSFSSVCSHQGAGIAVASWHIVSPGVTECLLGRVIWGWWVQAVSPPSHFTDVVSGQIGEQLNVTPYKHILTHILNAGRVNLSYTSCHLVCPFLFTLSFFSQPLIVFTSALAFILSVALVFS